MPFYLNIIQVKVSCSIFVDDQKTSVDGESCKVKGMLSDNVTDANLAGLIGSSESDVVESAVAAVIATAVGKKTESVLHRESTEAEVANTEST